MTKLVLMPQLNLSAIEEKDVRGKVESLCRSLRKVQETMVSQAIECGRLLSEIRDLIEERHGRIWVALLEDFGFTKSTAYRCIAVYDSFHDVPEAISFQDSAMYVLASAPNKAKREAINLADKGEIITHKIAKELIAKYTKPPKDEPARIETPTTDTETRTEASSGDPVGDACEHQWESDGNGSRYCSRCLIEHPDNPPPKSRKSDAAKHLGGIAATIVAARVKIDDLVREHGKHGLTDKIMSDLDKALIGLRQWAKAVEK